MINRLDTQRNAAGILSHKPLLSSRQVCSNVRTKYRKLAIFNLLGSVNSNPKIIGIVHEAKKILQKWSVMATSCAKRSCMVALTDFIPKKLSPAVSQKKRPSARMAFQIILYVDDHSRITIFFVAVNSLASSL